MKKYGSLLGHAILVGGMVYGLLAIVVVPASACTPTECDTISQYIDSFCQAISPTCNQGGLVISCDSTGWDVYCYGCNHAFGGSC